MVHFSITDFASEPDHSHDPDGSLNAVSEPDHSHESKDSLESGQPRTSHSIWLQLTPVQKLWKTAQNGGCSSVDEIRRYIEKESISSLAFKMELARLTGEAISGPPSVNRMSSTKLKIQPWEMEKESYEGFTHRCHRPAREDRWPDKDKTLPWRM